jgi:hypothetical protein
MRQPLLLMHHQQTQRLPLTVSNWYESSFAIEDAQAAQVMHSYTLQERYAKAAAYAIAKQLDTAIVSLFAGFSTVVGASTTNLADSEIRAAISALESANVDTAEAAILHAPSSILEASTKYRQVLSSN